MILVPGCRLFIYHFQFVNHTFNVTFVQTVGQYHLLRFQLSDIRFRLAFLCYRWGFLVLVLGPLTTSPIADRTREGFAELRASFETLEVEDLEFDNYRF